MGLLCSFLGLLRAARAARAGPHTFGLRWNCIHPARASLTIKNPALIPLRLEKGPVEVLFALRDLRRDGSVVDTAAMWFSEK